MATLLDLKTRIATEMVRGDLLDDLAAQLLLHIQRACEYFSDQRFWFNTVTTTGVTVASAETVTIPDAVRRVEGLTIPALNTTLDEYSLEDLDARPDLTGQPCAYAYYNDSIRLYPTPAGVYTLRFTGLKQIDPPSADGDSNEWTNEAQDLICARTRMTLYRDQFRDAEGAQMAVGATQEARDRLQAETAKRLKRPLRSPQDAPWGARRQLSPFL